MRQAEIALAQLGLNKGKVQKAKHRSIPRGVVIRSVPQAESWVKIGSDVELVVSSGGQGGVLLPNMVGTSLTQSKRLLDSLGFSFQQGILDTTDADLLPQTVLYQYPKGGEYLPEGTEISIKVSP